MEDNVNNSNNGVNYLFLIWLVLFVAKVTGHIDCSWWIINMPLFPFVFVIGLVCAIIVFLAIIGVIAVIGFLIICAYEEISERL